GPTRAVNGLLSLRDAKADRDLPDAIALARADEAKIGSGGIGIALPSEEPTIAHVLPLAHGDLRTRLVAQATAAVFITRAESGPPADIAALAASFGLTAAETRVLERLLGGGSLPEGAHALDISWVAATTRLHHIFLKTGVSRRADLVSWIDRLVQTVPLT